MCKENISLKRVGGTQSKRSNVPSGNGYIEEVQLQKKPLVTVITVTFNAGSGLEQTILSVLSHKSKDIEYIIIDGGSDDNTFEVLERYDCAIDYWVSERDRGIYNAMNKGLDLATGQWVTFLNVGDLYLGDVFRGVDFGCEHPVIFLKVMTGVTALRKKKRLDFGMPYCHQGILFKRELGIRYDEKYDLASDYQYLIDHLQGISHREVPVQGQGAVYFDTHGVSSSNKLKRDAETLLISLSNFGLGLNAVALGIKILIRAVYASKRRGWRN